MLISAGLSSINPTVAPSGSVATSSPDVTANSPQLDRFLLGSTLSVCI